MTFFATLIIFSAFANQYYVNYTSLSDDYTMDIAGGITPHRIPQQNGYLDVFQYVDSANGQNGPGYMMTVLRTTPRNDFKFSSINTKEFQQGYEDGCKCKITGSDEVQFNKEKGISYTMKYKKGKVAMAGYNVTFQKGSYLYIVNFSTTEAGMTTYFDEYFHSINSFDMHPSQMIVGGKYRNNSMAGK